jgi:hypothetical protein
MLRARHHLQVQLIGTAAQAVESLPALFQVLQNDGHSCDLTIVNQTEVVGIILKQKQNQFERQQKKDKKLGQSGKKWSDVRDDEKESVEILVKNDPPSTKYVVAWDIVFRSAKSMIPHITRVFFSEAMFMRSKMGGALYVTSGLDANHHTVPVSVSWSWGGENTLGWRSHASFVCKHLPEDLPVIIDGTVPASQAFEAYMPPKSELFMCSVHFTKKLKGKVKDFYQKAVKASTEDEFNQAKNLISPEQYDSLLAKVQNKTKRLFVRECEGLHGHSCRNAVESLNQAFMEARKAHHHIGQYIFQQRGFP